MEEDKNEQTLSDGTRIMSKTEFWSRLAVWAVLAVIAPVVYLSISCGLFSTNTADESLKLSGWGVLSIAFVGIMLLVILINVKNNLVKGTMARQCIEGTLILIPILCVILMIHVIKNNVDQVEKFLIVMLICELLAVPANPLPHWGRQNHIEKSENFIVNAIKKGFEKK